MAGAYREWQQAKQLRLDQAFEFTAAVSFLRKMHDYYNFLVFCRWFLPQQIHQFAAAALGRTAVSPQPMPNQSGNNEAPQEGRVMTGENMADGMQRVRDMTLLAGGLVIGLVLVAIAVAINIDYKAGAVASRLEVRHPLTQTQ